MPLFRFRLRAHGKDVSERTFTLDDIPSAETFGRGILANLERAGLRDGDYLIVENDEGQMVLNLSFSYVDLDWKLTGKAQASVGKNGLLWPDKPDEG